MWEVIDLYNTQSYRFVSELLWCQISGELKYCLLVYPRDHITKNSIEASSPKKPDAHSIIARTILDLTYIVWSKQYNHLQEMLHQDQTKTDVWMNKIFEKHKEKLVSYYVVYSKSP